MSDTHDANTNRRLTAGDTFEETILKMYALTELIPMVLSEDYGGPQDNDLRDGVGYLMADVRREMRQMSDEYWRLRNTKSDMTELRAVGAHG